MNLYSPPTLEAATLGNQGSKYSIDLYSGKLNYYAALQKVDLYGVSIDLGLQYSSSGFKVQDLASSTGLGWSLSIGGVIYRNVEGLPDEDENGYCGSNSIGSKSNLLPNGEYLNKLVKGDWDGQPDRFSFSFLGYSGEIRLTPNGDPVFQSNPHGLRIIYCPFNRTNGQASGGAGNWIVCDQLGNQYFFGEENVEKVNATYHGETENKSKSFIASWYIYKVITYQNRIIEFRYTKGAKQTFSYFVNAHRTISTSGCNPPVGNLIERTWSENVDTETEAPLFLESIQTSDGRTLVELTYEQNRLDVINGKALTGVAVRHNGSIVRKFAFNYGYFGENSQDPDYKRLKLSSIQENYPGGQNKNLYIFYYNSTVLPSRKSLQTDYWGYYNQNQGSSNIEGLEGANKEPDLERSKACVLERVVNSTGGSYNFEFELNNYNSGSSNVCSGGIRVSKTYENTGENANQRINETDYIYNVPGTSLSSGQVYSDERNRKLETTYSILVPINGTYAGCVIAHTYKYSEPLISLFDLNNVSVGYSNVSVKQADGSVIRYTYTNFSDFPDIFNGREFDTVDGRDLQLNSSYNIKPQLPTTSMAFARGKIKLEQMIDANGDIVKETTYSYSLVSEGGLVFGIKSFVSRTLNQYYKYIYSKYDFDTRALKLDSKLETYKKDGIKQQETFERYAYSTIPELKNLVARKTVSISGGREENFYYRYPRDVKRHSVNGDSYSSPVAFMVNNNMENYPIETVHSIKYNNENEYVIDVNVLQYGGNTAHSVVPVREFSLESDSPIPINEFYRYYVDFNPDDNEERNEIDQRMSLQYINMFDSFGNLIEKSAYFAGATKTKSVLYDKYGNYVIAEIDNASQHNIYVKNFEEEESDYTGNIFIDGSRSHTGRKSLKFYNDFGGVATGVCSKRIPVTRLGGISKYKYSCWIYSEKAEAGIILRLFPNESGNSSQLRKMSTKEVNKWVLLEGEVDIPSNIYWLSIDLDVTGQGHAWFDDIRLFPYASSVQTYTIEPFKGVSSKTDERNRTTYYEYDEKNRLSIIRDHNQNILEAFCYNFKDQRTNCFSVYYNSARLRTFVKNDCQTCCLGGTAVSFSVPAGMFKAGSQAAADQMAEDYLVINGQTFANKYGACNIQVPFARVEYTNRTPVYSTDDQGFYHYKETADVKIRFYADSSCTIPAALVADKDIIINTDVFFGDDPREKYDQYETTYQGYYGDTEISLGNMVIYSEDEYIDNLGYVVELYSYELSVLNPSNSSYIALSSRY
ncbi:DUF5977 domain-containing protein [Arcticibacter tournemirensis]